MWCNNGHRRRIAQRDGGGKAELSVDKYVQRRCRVLGPVESSDRFSSAALAAFPETSFSSMDTLRSRLQRHGTQRWSQIHQRVRRRLGLSSVDVFAMSLPPASRFLRDVTAPTLLHRPWRRVSVPVRRSLVG